MNNLSIKYGVIFALISIVSSIALWATGSLISLGWLSGIVSIVACVLVLRALLLEAKSTMYNGVLTFNNGFKESFMAMVVSTVILTVFTYIFYEFIYTNWQEEAKQAAIEMMEKFNVPDEQMQVELAKIDAKSVIEQTWQAGLFGFVISAIFSAIMAAVMKTKKQAVE